MAQKLILPINQCKLTASWKTSAYYKRFGFAHYGVDMVSTAGQTLLYASGNGEVAAVGRDHVVGNVVAIKYYDAVHRSSGRSWNMIFRYYHLAKISVKKGQKVDKDTVLGNYGNTGSLQMARHLHIEADIDCAYPLYSPTVRSSNLIKGTAAGANDKTMYNPLEWLHCKTSGPDRQSFTHANDPYIRAEDKSIASIT